MSASRSAVVRYSPDLMNAVFPRPSMKTVIGKSFGTFSSPAMSSSGSS